MGSYILASTLNVLLLVSLLFTLTMPDTQVPTPTATVSNYRSDPAERTTYQSTPHPSCPSNVKCELLAGNCLSEIDGCNQTCDYGEMTQVDVHVHDSVPCIGERNHTRSMSCRFCYQLPNEQYSCSMTTSCNSVGTYSSRVYKSTCEVHPTIICFGKRRFYKNQLCHWTNGYSWSTTLVLSITLGGFGADRFYLGHWKEGIGKLFSFGGLGVWTLVDVVLIAIGYVSPGDGSLYTFRANVTSPS